MYQDTTPAAYWQNQLYEWGPRVLLAVLILVVTHFVAKAVQWGLARIINRVPILKRDPHTSEKRIGKEVGRLGYWIVWLVGLIAALQPLGLSGVLTPVTALTNEVFAFIPKLLGAGLFFFAGLILARIVRHIIEAALGALNLEKLASRAGLKLGDEPDTARRAGDDAAIPIPTRNTIARAVGMTVSAIIIIFAAIGALDILQIEAVSEPSKNMLNMIALAIPQVIAALLIVAIFLIAGRWVKTLIETVLPSFGFDRGVMALGIIPDNVVPSRVLGTVAMIALILIGLMEAARKVGGDSSAALLFQVTELGGKVIFGTVIIVAGLFLARILATLIGSSTGEGGYAQTIVKYAIIALFTAIGLTFMGLADEIVMMAFGLILGSAAIATALAFGLGGRDWAARQLDRWQSRRSGPIIPPAPRIDPSGQPPLV
ncbi:MAG: mechanosensitive ion channel [Sphingomicrobium sp.]